MNIETGHALILAGPKTGTGSGIDLTTGWSSFFGILPSGLVLAMSVFGVGLIIYAVGSHMWRKHRGSGGGGGIHWGLLLGFLLASPGVIGPLVLGISDVFATLVVNAANIVTG